MKKSLLVLVLVLALATAFAPVLAQAEAGDIVVRLRGTHVNPSESSSLGQKTDGSYGAGTAQLLYGNPKADLRVDSNTILELDVSYISLKTSRPS